MNYMDRGTALATYCIIGSVVLMWIVAGWQAGISLAIACTLVIVCTLVAAGSFLRDVPRKLMSAEATYNQPLRWQDGKPTEPGWYWVRDHEGNKDYKLITLIYRPQGEDLRVADNSTDLDHRLADDQYIVAFAGPIQEPIS